MYLHLQLIHIPDTLLFNIYLLFPLLCLKGSCQNKELILAVTHTQLWCHRHVCVCVWEHSCSSQASYVTYRAQAVDL